VYYIRIFTVITKHIQSTLDAFDSRILSSKLKVALYFFIFFLISYNKNNTVIQLLRYMIKGSTVVLRLYGYRNNKI